MKIFTLGIDEGKMDAIRWKFGRAEYIDVTDAYQEILALCADIVIIAVDQATEDVIATIKEFQEEAADATEYHYVTNEEIEDWFIEFYIALDNSLAELTDAITPEEFEALQLLGIQKYDSGLISHVRINDDIKYYEFYRPEVGKRELLILSFGDDLIDAATYHAYKKEYDIVSVGCYKEKQTRLSSLMKMFEDRTPKEELPPVLWQIEAELDKDMEPYVYAYFGE